MAEPGRPTVMTPETIKRLEDGFIAGLSDREASLYADTAPSTLYAYCEENPDFSERKELLKERIKMRAKFNISEAIEAKDKTLSQWLLERRDPDFKPKNETDTKGQVTVNIVRFEDSNPPPQLHPEDVSAPTPSGA
jgi:hypothetical protein